MCLLENCFIFKRIACVAVGLFGDMEKTAKKAHEEAARQAVMVEERFVNKSQLTSS